MRARWQALTPAHTAAATSPYLPPQNGLAPTAAHSVCVLIRHLHLFPRRAAASDKTFGRLCVKLFTHRSCVGDGGGSTCRWWNLSSLKSWWAFFSPPSRSRNSHTWLPEDFPGYNFNRFRFSWILCCNKTWQTYVLLVLFLF